MRHIFVIIFFLILQSVNGFCALRRTTPEKHGPGFFLYTAVAEEFLKENKWGYYIDEDFFWIYSGSVAYDVSLKFQFFAKKFYDEEKTARFFYGIYKDAIKRVHDIRILRPFLSEFPLDPMENFFLHLIFKKTKKERYPGPYLSYMKSDNGILKYARGSFNENPSTVEKGIIAEDVLEEKDPFAIRGVPRKPCDSIPKVPTWISFGSSFFWRSRTFLENFEEHLFQLCKEKELLLLVVGFVGPKRTDGRPFGFSLMGYQQLDLSEAKKLAHECYKKTAAFVQKNKCCLKKMKECFEKKYKAYPSATFIPEYVAFRISFWDQYIDRPVSPYIAEIRLFDGRLFYYTADEGQNLKLVDAEILSEVIGE